METNSPDEHLPIIIMGGGPAGVFTACGLKELGHDPIIITRPRPFPAWEGMSERPLNTLRHFGFQETLKAVGPMVNRTAHWNGKSQLQNREYILDRSLFDQALLRDAQNKGIRVIEGRIHKVEGQGSSQSTPIEKHWSVSYQPKEGPIVDLGVEFLVDARGREAKLGRKEFHSLSLFPKEKRDRQSAGPATSAVLKSYDVPRDIPAMTAVASFPKGWAWHVRDGKGTAILQIFVSSEKGALPVKTELDTFFAGLVQQLPEALDWLKDAVPHSNQVSVRTAAPKVSSPPGGENFLVVGDGSLALDPLSGNGIFYAIGSGLAAAPVINSLLKKPEDKHWALQFFQDRVDLAFKGGCLMGREFYAAEERWPKENFWAARRSWPKEAGSSHPDPLSAPSEICLKPVVKDGFIVPEQVVVTPDHPRGVWQIDGVSLVPLWELIQKGSDNDSDNAHYFGVPKENITTARKWLKSRHITQLGEAENESDGKK